jgi:large subunit ribosomal protein L3
MKFILGKKISMTQVFDKEGVAHAATVLSAPAAVVTQIKTLATDGYKAVQVGFGTRNANRISKAVKGHVKDLGSFAYLKEFRLEDGAKDYALGEKIGLEAFAEGDTVEVSAISKGKGFQGVVKRHGFGGGPRTHGQKHSEREPGSIGGGLRNKVPKNMRMAGRMGGDRVTVKNLKVLHVDTVLNNIVIKGAVPGRTGTLVEVRG